MVNREILENLRSTLKQTVKGQDENCDLAICALLAGGHVLLEGLPGLGKTLMARTIASLISVDFKRVQCTPDLMPADLLGTSILQNMQGSLKFNPGPIFTTIFMADELNRANPRTQSALLEAMQEKQISIEGETKRLSDLFFCIATQNPIELEGTYPLPEAQLDRFLFRISMDYPEKSEEQKLLMWYSEGHGLLEYPSSTSTNQATEADIRELKKEVNSIVLKEGVINYILDLVLATRNHKDIDSGASPRASIALLCASRSWAYLQGRDFVTPDDVKRIFKPALSHRMRLSPESELNGATLESILDTILGNTKIPV